MKRNSLTNNSIRFPILLIFALLLVSLFASSVLAIGIAPAKTQIPLQEGVYEYKGIVINNDGLNANAYLLATIANPSVHITFSEDVISFDEQTKEYFFSYQINVTQNLSEDLNGLRIGEITLKSLQNTGQVAAQLTLTSPLYLGTSASQVQAVPDEDQEEVVQEDDSSNLQNTNANVEEENPNKETSFVSKTKNAIHFEAISLKPKTIFAVIATLVLVSLLFFAIGFSRSKDF